MEDQALKEKILTLDEAAQLLRLHPEVLRRKARKGEIPAAKVGRQWRFRLQRLLEWLDEGGSGTPEREAKAPGSKHLGA